MDSKFQFRARSASVEALSETGGSTTGAWCHPSSCPAVAGVGKPIARIILGIPADYGGRPFRNMRRPVGAARLIEVTVVAYRGIDILINNVAGVARVADSSDDDWRGSLDELP